MQLGIDEKVSSPGAGVKRSSLYKFQTGGNKDVQMTVFFTRYADLFPSILKENLPKCMISVFFSV